MMTDWEASKKRISCRAFEDRLIEEDVLEALEAHMQDLNAKYDLSFTLIVSREAGKPAIKMAPAMFSGPVYAFAALVGGEDALSGEKIGYYGQDLVLTAEKLGLGTCWVASTYDRKSFDLEVPEDQEIRAVIPMGYAPEKMPLKQQLIRAGIRRSDRKPEEVLESGLTLDQVPAYVRMGIEAVLDGPSAVNGQPVNIVYDRGKVWARLWKTEHGIQFLDLGIAKRQFEIGAAEAGTPGRFVFGDGGHFLPDA